MPALSIILPARNAEATVGAAVKCILEQTFTDLELLAIDDGSTDATAGVLRGLTDPRVRVLDGGGRGLVAALNLGLGASRATRFIGRMDADDECLPARLERSVRALEADATLAGVGTQVELFRRDRPVSPNLAAYGAWLNALTSPALLFRDRLVESPLCHGSVLLHRAPLERVGGWRDGAFPEDWELWLRLLESGHALSCVPEVLYRWADHDTRLTRTDPRYSHENHLALKARYVAARFNAVLIAGAGDTGLKLSRLLRAHGVAVEGFVDVNPKKIGHRLEGLSVISPQSLGGPAGHAHLLCAAGSKGARAELRTFLGERGWSEGEHFTCVA
jgi:glycosyltransferase involved in cell wall biosynthesis